MSEPGRHEHECRVPVGKAAEDACAAPHFAQDPFERIVGPNDAARRLTCEKLEASPRACEEDVGGADRALVSAVRAQLLHPSVLLSRSRVLRMRMPRGRTAPEPSPGSPETPAVDRVMKRAEEPCSVQEVCVVCGRSGVSG